MSLLITHHYSLQGNQIVNPPIVTRAPGRPRRNRIKGHDEKNIPAYDKKGVKRCGKCSGFGHNSRGCQGGPTAREIRQGATRGMGGRGGARAGGAGIGGRGGGRAGGRGSRGGRGGGRAGARRPFVAPKTTQVRVPLNLPPPPTSNTSKNQASTSKRRKIFHPSSVPYLP